MVHRPGGDGHPYHCADDAREPWVVVAGEPVHLGVSAAEGVERVVVEIEEADGEVSALPLTRNASRPAPPPGAEGHLDLAQAAAGRGGGWRVTLPHAPGSPWRYRFRAWDASDGQCLTPFFAVDPAAWTTAPVGHLDCAAARQDRVEWLVSCHGLVHRVRFGLVLEPEEHVVGFGERYDAVDQRGRRPDVRVFEQYKGQAAARRTYFPVPFAHVVGGRGWGFHVRTARRVRFDVGASDPRTLVVEADLDASEACPRLSVGVWEGEPVQVLDAFLSETGRPASLPPWVFGLWASGNEWNTQATVMAQVERHAREGVPISVVVIEAWSDEEGFCVFRDARYHGDPTQPYDGALFSYPQDGAWPDPRGMVEELHRRGIRVVLWQVPLQKDEPGLGALATAQRDALLESGHVVRLGDGRPYANRGWWFPGALMPDLTTPDGAAWWAQWRRYLVRDIGVDGFKTDGGEHAWGHDLVFADGTSGEEGANRYPVAYARTFTSLLEQEGKAPVTFSRSGFTGSQSYGAFWAGDEDSTWAAMRASLRAGLTVAACGVVNWGWDIAGFSGPVPGAELYLRAWGASVFLPIMQYHSEFNGHRTPSRDRTPWNVAEVNQAPEVLGVVRSLTALRQRLRPYLEREAAHAVGGDGPLLRGLFIDHPRDEAAWDADTEFLLGRDILVNPITQPGTSQWCTYLPEGDWVDPWTGKEHHGRGWLSRAYALDEVPVMVRTTAWERLRAVFDRR